MDHRKIVVLGSSYSAYAVFNYIENFLFKLREPFDLLLISPKPYFYIPDLFPQFVCNLASIAEVTHSFRESIALRPGVGYLEADILGINFSSQILSTSKGKVKYDYLVLAPEADRFEENKLQASSPVHYIFSPMDLIILKNKVLKNLEEAVTESDSEKKNQLLTYTVIGGGKEGIGLAFSLYDFIKHKFNKQYFELNKLLIKVNLIEKENLVDKNKTPFYNSRLLYNLNKKGINLYTNSTITKISQDKLIVNGNFEIIPGTLINSELHKQSSLIQLLPGVQNSDYGNVGLYLKLEEVENTYLIGQFSNCLDFGDLLPSSVLFYKKQAQLCASNIFARINNLPEKPFKAEPITDIVSLGYCNSLVQVKDICFDGIAGWLTQRFLYMKTLIRFKKIFASCVRFIFDFFGMYAFNIPENMELENKRQTSARQNY